MDDAGEDEPTFHLLSRTDLEEAVRERTEYLENLMDTMVDVLLHLEPDGRISTVNRACTEILGYEEDDVIGKPIDYIFADRSERESLSTMLSRADFVERLLTDGHLTDVEVPFETRGGRTIPMSLSASTMEAEDGSISGIVCVAKDISERKDAEETAEFLNSLLRHDLGNKLQLTYGGLDGALSSEDPDRMRSQVEVAFEGVEEAMELIQNVRTLQRIGGVDEARPVELEGLIERCAGQFEQLRDDRGMTIDVDVSPDTTVLGGALLKELFANLIENALIHSDGETVRIRSCKRGADVVISVEDDGRGIDPDVAERVLNKGVKGTTSSGSGLGTYLSRRIARGYGGGLEIDESELGGARFDVVLRAAD